MGRNKKLIWNSISKKRHSRKLRSKLKKKNGNNHQNENFKALKKLTFEDSTLEIIQKLGSPILKFLISNERSNFHYDKIRDKALNAKKSDFIVPEHFSIIENPEKSFRFIQTIFGTLLIQNVKELELDYKHCKKADLGAQVLLDIIMKEVLDLYNKCITRLSLNPRLRGIGGKNINNPDVKKLLFSVGSPSILFNKSYNFEDIITYKLCVHNRAANGNKDRISAQKDIDTTTLVDYVMKCLKRIGRSLTPERLDDLCIVISEILINAEEHATTNYRFSIGYFHEILGNGKKVGVFRLVILNFGQTIYEKFKAPDCPNKHIVDQMKSLSNHYNRSKFFLPKAFEEETLWTLYSLQEGVTSVAPDKYKKRGHGSIQFIERFFNIKGNDRPDNFSKMAILSGNSKIIFDGQYAIQEKENDAGEKFKYMTFNESGNIEEKPDKDYVKYSEEYFPGTIISAKILFDEDDFTDETK